MIPLQSASGNGRLEVVRVLLEAGANIEAGGEVRPRFGSMWERKAIAAVPLQSLHDERKGSSSTPTPPSPCTHVSVPALCARQSGAAQRS